MLQSAARRAAARSAAAAPLFATGQSRFASATVDDRREAAGPRERLLATALLRVPTLARCRRRCCAPLSGACNGS